MDKLINQAIVEILRSRPEVVRIALRQKAKFEGWLKFELASLLESKGMELVEVESTQKNGIEFSDISFFHEGEPYRVELKTSNTNWKVDSVRQATKPITKNIQSIISDTKKMNSYHGIMAFVLFPIPMHDRRWENYIDRICNETQLNICKQTNCNLVEADINGCNMCQLLVCSYISANATTFSVFN